MQLGAAMSVHPEARLDNTTDVGLDIPVSVRDSMIVASPGKSLGIAMWSRYRCCKHLASLGKIP